MCFFPLESSSRKAGSLVCFFYCYILRAWHIEETQVFVGWMHKLTEVHFSHGTRIWKQVGLSVVERLIMPSESQALSTFSLCQPQCVGMSLFMVSRWLKLLKPCPSSITYHRKKGWSSPSASLTDHQESPCQKFSSLPKTGHNWVRHPSANQQLAKKKWDSPDWKSCHVPLLGLTHGHLGAGQNQSCVGF